MRGEASGALARAALGAAGATFGVLDRARAVGWTSMLPMGDKSAGVVGCGADGAIDGGDGALDGNDGDAVAESATSAAGCAPCLAMEK